METVLGALIGVVGALCGAIIGVVAGIAGAFLQRRWALDDLRREMAKRDIEESWAPIEDILDKLLQDVQATRLESQQDRQISAEQRLEELQSRVESCKEIVSEYRTEFALKVLNDKALTAAFNELCGIVNQLGQTSKAKDKGIVEELMHKAITTAAVVRRRKLEILHSIYKS